MSKTYKAKIKWLAEEQGGRKTLPHGDKYGPIISIGKPLSLSEENWSLIVKNKETLGEYETIAEVSYLSKKAPDNLRKNVEFELYEGRKLVAKGVVL
ncbi:MAG: hypothetical protein LBQ48_00680 [Oscillospiraceae bacterium]|jgi:hypothetical protein|nr:hypothetical protein [Oscillospiraceae bacterium]